MPRIFGQEIQGKTLWIVLGVIAAGVAVVVFVRSRGGAGEPAFAAPEAAPEGGGFSGGGGGGFAIPAPSAPMADNYNTALEGIQLDAARFQLDQARREAGEQARQFDLAYSVNQAWADLQRNLFGLETQVGGARAGYEMEQYRTAQAAQEVVTRHTKTKKKVECPPGEHLVVTPEGGAHCQAKGGGGFSLKTAFTGAGNVVRGIFQGAAAAAPGIGYGAAQYGAAQAGILPGQQQRRPRDTQAMSPVNKRKANADYYGQRVEA